MTDEIEYAIGHADSIGVIVAGGIWTIEYDLKQAQDEGFVKYRIPELDDDMDYDGYRQTDELDLGENISLAVADHAVEEIGHVYGFVVPDHLLGIFIEHYPDKEVLREQ